MSQINIMDLTFYYEGSYDPIFEHVSLKLDTNWKLGFIGRNGRGKTTFLKLLMKQYEYFGIISVNVEFEYFPYVVSNKELHTTDIIAEITPNYEVWKLAKEMRHLHVDEEVLERPFSTLSNGEQTKVLLAALFIRENNFLLIDEPTNHLDREAREIVAAYLNGKKGYILVSHDRSFLDRCVDHILSINKTNIDVQKGNFTSWHENKDAQDRYEINQNEKLKGDIKRLSESAKRTSNWSEKIESTKKGTRDSGLRPDRGFIGHKSAKMMKRSKAIESRQQSAIEEKSKLLKNIEAADYLKITPLNYHSERLVLLDDVSILYDNNVVCEHLNFQILRGDRISLSGENGCGKTSVLKLILGDNIDYAGSIEIGSGLKISYVPQDTSHIKGSLKEFAKSSAIDETLFKTVLRKLDFERVQFEKNIEEYSDGQKKKVLIAKSLCEQAHLYIWDEPLNYIDVLSCIQIEKLILAHKPTILFVEHDKTFRDKIATKVEYLAAE